MGVGTTRLRSWLKFPSSSSRSSLPLTPGSGAFVQNLRAQNTLLAYGDQSGLQNKELQIRLQDLDKNNGNSTRLGIGRKMNSRIRRARKVI